MRRHPPASTIDTLVHNFLHRTGIRTEARPAMHSVSKAYSKQVDAATFNPTFPFSRVSFNPPFGSFVARRSRTSATATRSTRVTAVTSGIVPRSEHATESPCRTASVEGSLVLEIRQPSH